MEADASSAAAACSVAPWDMDWALTDSSTLPAATLSAAVRTSVTTSTSFATMADRACISSSSSERCRRSTIRLPSATCLAAAAILPVASMSRFRLFLTALKSPW